MSNYIPSRPAIALAFLTLLLVLAGCGGSSTAAQQDVELGAATPEAVLDRIRRAAETRNMLELVASVDQESAKGIAEDLTMGAAMMVAFSAFGGDEQTVERLASELNAIVTRHGLPSMDDDSSEGPAEIQQALGRLDHATLANLVVDLEVFLKSMSEEQEQSDRPLPLPLDGDLTELAIDGDSATGKVGEEAIEFVRVSGRWFARVPEPAPFEMSSSSGEQSSEAADFWKEWEDRNRAGSENAAELSIPLSKQDALDESGRRWYRFQAAESGHLRLATSSTGENDGDLVIKAYREGNFSDSVAHADEDRDGDRANEVLEFGLQAGEVLMVNISQFGYSDSPLTFNIEAGFTPGDVQAAQPMFR